MDNLFAATCSLLSLGSREGTGYQWLSRVATSLKGVAGMLWNQWPDSSGMGGRLGVEWVAGLDRNTHKEKWEALLGFRASSLPGYLFSRKREDFIDYELILGQMGGDRRKGRQGYREFIQWGIEHEPESPLELGKGHGIVGESDFVEWIKERFVEKEVPRREQPALRELTREYEPEKLMDRFAELVDREKGDICRRGRHSLERSILMEYLYRFCRLDQAEIGKLMGGIDYSAVSQARKRLQLRLRQDPGLMKRFAELSERLLQLSKINGLLPKSLDLVGKLPSE
jgi:hypothetical protein